MKKLLTIIGIIILIPIVLVIALLVIISFIPMTPNNYTKEVKTGGDIETKYLSNYKENSDISTVTIDNIRRVMSSFLLG